MTGLPGERNRLAAALLPSLEFEEDSDEHFGERSDLIGSGRRDFLDEFCGFGL